MAQRTAPIKIVILVIVWALFISTVVQFSSIMSDGGFSTHPTGAFVTLVVAGFLAGGCISLTRMWIRERRGNGS